MPLPKLPLRNTAVMLRVPSAIIIKFTDTELHKFKCELEADNKGITELLEKRSLELDVNTNHTSTSNNNHYKENR